MTQHVLAHRHGPMMIMTILVVRGQACGKCGSPTRATSKNWARCKNDDCGERVRRRSADEAVKIINQALGATEAKANETEE